MLQIESRDGSWVDAVPVPNTVVVMVADLLTRWTSDRLVSPVTTDHSVVRKGGG